MLKPNSFLQVDDDSKLSKRLTSSLKTFGKAHEAQLVFIIQAPLGMDSSYEYDGAIILSPNHKITFLGTSNDDEFEDYIDDVFDDISALSKKYNYQKYIGRIREWRDDVHIKKVIRDNEEIDLEEFIGDGNNIIDPQNARRLKFLISLFTGSINELNAASLEEKDDILEQIKNKIVLFDADQTRFLYREQPIRKAVSVQGLSGTGKTELLLHKLKDIYEGGNKVFFTCHNIALANELKARIPSFFNRMQVARQIEWSKELWVAHAWGSQANQNSGLYSYICRHYNLPFYQYNRSIGYEFIFSKILEGLNRIPKSKFAPCFDYILVDENQDFPEVFFDVCKKIVRHKVYTAGDVFQNIFDPTGNNVKGVDISLNRCYRTDPRTLMFAHCLGLGLKERIRYNWFEKKEWENFGYKVEKGREKNTISLLRQPTSRFEGQDPEKSVEIIGGTDTKHICDILNGIKEQYPTVKPGDVAIIMIDDDKEIYSYMDSLAIKIRKNVGWGVLRGHEDKHTEPDKLYLTNTNNVKGLEFPFVICITSKILNHISYRNKIYTMLTRSFLITYLVIKDVRDIDWLAPLYEEIAAEGAISNIKLPDEQEKQRIKHAVLTQIEDNKESWHDFMEKIFIELNIIDPKKKAKGLQMVNSLSGDRFDAERIKEFLSTVKDKFL